jgi:hypothetical protein
MMRLKDDPEWQMIKFNLQRLIDNNFRWPMIWRMLIWIVRLSPDTPAGQKVMRAIHQVHKDCIEDVAGETAANYRRIENAAKHRER